MLSIIMIKEEIAGKECLSLLSCTKTAVFLLFFFVYIHYKDLLMSLEISNFFTRQHTDNHLLNPCCACAHGVMIAVM